jgi:hypothetical protein
VLEHGADAQRYVYQIRDPWGDSASSLRFRHRVCRDVDLTPAYAQLTEADLVEFLRARGHSLRVERPRDDLAYVVVEGSGTERPARLRVAILDDADQAGRELAEAIREHGSGSWGVHRSNLAVLGPTGSDRHDLAFAARTQLVCWGAFTIAGRSGAVAIPGGYREL